MENKAEEQKKSIGLYVTDEEYDLIKQASELVSRTMSNFVTMCAKQRAKEVIQQSLELSKEVEKNELQHKRN